MNYISQYIGMIYHSDISVKILAYMCTKTISLFLYYIILVTPERDIPRDILDILTDI